MDIRKVGVIGAGTMGHGIAQVAAMAGCEVVLQDLQDEVVQRGLDHIHLGVTFVRLGLCRHFRPHRPHQWCSGDQ